MKQWVMGSFYRIVQERKPPTASQLKKLEDWRNQNKEKDHEYLRRTRPAT